MIFTATNQEIIVGFEDEAEKIIHELQNEKSSELGIFSITGMAGQGKTVLAKKVYSHSSIKSEFQVLAWCCVSQQYRKRELLLDLLRNTAVVVNYLSHGFHYLNNEDLGEFLFKSLSDRRYLVVFDDIWDIEVWHDVRSYFPDNNNGSRILFTTQIQSLGLKANSRRPPHFVRPLSDSESFELLQRKLQLLQSKIKNRGPASKKRRNDDSYYVPDRNYVPTVKLPENLMKQIAKNCKGLPFSVVTLTDILANMEIESWGDVAESSSTSLPISCTRALELSYNGLPDYLKPCLLYLGSFLQDQEILVSMVVRRWIAEGLIVTVQQQPTTDEKKISLEGVAMDYLRDLIDRSLVTVAKEGSNGGIKACRVDDLVHQFCVTRAKQENFLLQLQNLNQEPDHPSSETEPNRLCIYNNSWENLLQHSGRNLSSLIFFGNNGHGRLSLLSEFFSHTKLLKVLDLRGFTCSSFPSQVETLVHLRYLALSGLITSVPSTIVRLENLETFLLKGLLSEISLPFNILLQLRKLKHLQGNNHVVFNMPEDESSSVDQEMPRDVESSNLETFGTLLLSSGQLEFEEIILKKILPKIRKLKCTFLRSRCLREQYPIPAMDFLTNLESLNLRSIAKVGYDLKFKFPSNLKKLTLSNFHLPWPKFTMLISSLRNLEVLKLLNKACEGESWDMGSEKFSNLKYLKLQNSDIVHWNAGSDNFPRLQQVVLDGCDKLEGIPSGVVGKGSRTIHVTHCNDFLVNWARDLEKEIGAKLTLDY